MARQVGQQGAWHVRRARRLALDQQALADAPADQAISSGRSRKGVVCRRRILSR
jgi:hypothetical protein